MRTRQKVAAILTGLVLTAGMVVGSTSPALAGSDAGPASVANEPPNWVPSDIGVMACGWEPGENGSGGATVSKSVFLKSGPHSGCDYTSDYPIPVGARLGGWCFTTNDSGNRWYYVSVGGTSPWGWIYSGNVKNVSTFDTPCR